MLGLQVLEYERISTSDHENHELVFLCGQSTAAVTATITARYKTITSDLNLCLFGTTSFDSADFRLCLPDKLATATSSRVRDARPSLNKRL